MSPVYFGCKVHAWLRLRLLCLSVCVYDCMCVCLYARMSVSLCVTRPTSIYLEILPMVSPVYLLFSINLLILSSSGEGRGWVAGFCTLLLVLTSHLGAGAGKPCEAPPPMGATQAGPGKPRVRPRQAWASPRQAQAAQASPRQARASPRQAPGKPRQARASPRQAPGKPRQARSARVARATRLARAGPGRPGQHI